MEGILRLDSLRIPLRQVRYLYLATVYVLTSDPPPSGLLSILGPRSCPYNIVRRDSNLQRGRGDNINDSTSYRYMLLCTQVFARVRAGPPIWRLGDVSGFGLPRKGKDALTEKQVPVDIKEGRRQLLIRAP